MVAQSRAKLFLGNQCSIDERLFSFTMTTIYMYILFYNGTEGRNDLIILRTYGRHLKKNTVSVITYN